MRKFINDPERVVDEMLEGLLLAHADQIKSVREDNRALVRIDAPKQGKVGIVTGGGSGHLPLFLGYVGQGMLDGVAVGDVFQSPSAQQMLDATRAVHGGAGVLYLFGNYGGDVMNFEMAAEMAEMEDIKTATSLGADDVASGAKGEEDKRRGVAGIFYQYKIASARAEEGGSLEEVKAAADKAGARTRTMGVALSPCVVPAVGRPTFEIGEDEMEIGMGIHGEPGITRGKIDTADNVTHSLVERILDDMPLESGSEVSVLVNGLGATPLEELYIIYRKAHQLLVAQGIEIHRAYVGEYATSMEMAGMSISVCQLDDELKSLLDRPMNTPFHRQF